MPTSVSGLSPTRGRLSLKHDVPARCAFALAVRQDVAGDSTMLRYPCGVDTSDGSFQHVHVLERIVRLMANEQHEIL